MEGGGAHSPMDGGQFGGLPADGECRTVEVSLGPGLIEREKSIAVAFELHPEQWALGSLGQLWHSWGQRGNRLGGRLAVHTQFLRLMTYFQE